MDERGDAVGMVGLIIRVRTVPGKRDEVIELFKKLIPAVEAEKGCPAYSVHTDDEDPDSIWLYEIYIHAGALLDHTRTDWQYKFGSQMMPNIVAQEPYWLTPVGGFGVGGLSVTDSPATADPASPDPASPDPATADPVTADGAGVDGKRPTQAGEGKR
jgi:quinol monooxygenase YgiN